MFQSLSVFRNISSHPYSYQIAGYNIHPAPVLNFNELSCLDRPCVEVMLLEVTNNRELKGGFQIGHMRSFHGNSVQFGGLKLSKMFMIKEELQRYKIPRKGAIFALRFKLGLKHWDSEPFMLVSNCSQVPKDIKPTIRHKRRRPSIPDVSEATSKQSKKEESLDALATVNTSKRVETSINPCSIKFLLS